MQRKYSSAASSLQPAACKARTLEQVAAYNACTLEQVAFNNACAAGQVAAHNACTLGQLAAYSACTLRQVAAYHDPQLPADQDGGEMLPRIEGYLRGGIPCSTVHVEHRHCLIVVISALLGQTVRHQESNQMPGFASDNRLSIRRHASI